jgi:arylsulfatase
VLEAAGLPEPLSVNGVQQKPIEGVSMVYSFDDADAPERHETQYFEMFGNRGIYHQGWTAVTRHKTPWLMIGEEVPAFDDDVWELYDTSVDWSQAQNLAAENPDRLRDLQRLWLIEATKYQVLPMEDRLEVRFDPDRAGRPSLIRGNSQMLFGGMGRLTESSVLNIKNKSHALTAQLEVPEGGAAGVIVAQGAQIGGWSLYVNDGKPAYCYNFLGLKQFKVYGEEPIPAGEHQVRMEFAYDGGGLGKGGLVSLYVDGSKVGEGRVEATEAMIFSADETTDVGTDSGTAVSDDYAANDNAFNGRVRWVQIDIDAAAADQDHLISPEERLRLVMARQ